MVGRIDGLPLCSYPLGAEHGERELDNVPLVLIDSHSPSSPFSNAARRRPNQRAPLHLTFPSPSCFCSAAGASTHITTFSSAQWGRTLPPPSLPPTAAPASATRRKTMKIRRRRAAEAICISGRYPEWQVVCCASGAGCSHSHVHVLANGGGML